jgi:hypothetical protein
MTPLRLGKVPSGLGTADLFITISEGDQPLLRVDLYGETSSESYVSQDVIVWREHVFVGCGHTVHVIEPKKQMGRTISLGGTCAYFSAFHAGPEYLLVVSGEGVLRLDPDGEVLWKASDLAIDGVTVESIEGGLIKGSGDWDPPGGYRPFVIRLDSGESVS